MASSSTKFIGGATLQKELQGFAGFLAYQECFRKGTSTTKALLEKSMGDQYFGNPGNPDSIGLAEQLVLGNGVFSGLYNEEAASMLVGDPQTNQQHREPTVLLLKPCLHCLSDTQRIIVGHPAGIGLSLILANGLRNNLNFVSNRTLLCRAQEHLKNGKKALSLVMHAKSPYRAYTATGNLPSGLSIEDYYLYVRQKMFLLLNPPSSVPVEPEMPVAGGEGVLLDNIDMTADPDVSPMPDSWVFPGFIIFALLGPIVPPEMTNYRLELLMTSTPETGDSAGLDADARRKRRKTKGRATLRNAVAHENLDASSGNGSRRSSAATRQTSGCERQELSLNQKISLAGIAQSKVMIDHREQSQISDRIIAMNRKKVGGQKLLLDEHKYLISKTPDNDPQLPLYLRELREMNKALADAIIALAAAEQAIIDQSLLDMNARKMQPSDFVDLTIASFSSSSARPAGTPPSLPPTVSTPASSIFVPLPTTRNASVRSFSSISPIPPIMDLNDAADDVARRGDDNSSAGSSSV